MNNPIHQNQKIPKEYQVYLHPDFDPQSFANAILNNEPYLSIDISQIASGEVSLALSKLNVGIEDITKQLRSEVTTHHLKLLTRASSIASLQDSLQSIKNGLAQIESNVEKLQLKIGSRYSELQNALNRLDRYQSAAEFCRRTNRFISLAKRLQTQISEFDLNSNQIKSQNENQIENSSRHQPEIVLTESALTLSELEKLFDSELESPEISSDQDQSTPKLKDSINEKNSSIRSLRVIQPHLSSIITARKKVEHEMKNLLNQGVLKLDQAILATSFQTAYNLSILDHTVASLIFDLTEVVKNKVKLTFDLNSLARDADLNEPPITSSFGYKSRARTEPTLATLPQWSNALWVRLGGLIDDLTSCCIKVYTIEKVLEWKKNPVNGVSFLEEVMTTNSVLEERPSTVFWTTLSNALEKETREASKTSNFINQTLTTSYPRLLRLFHDFFSRISLHTHSTYNSNTQSPETVLTLRAILTIENTYLTRSMMRMTEAAHGRADKLTSVIVNELDAARFDPLLVKSVAKKVKELIENYVKRLDDRVITDYQSTSLAGPVVNSSQVTNIELLNSLSQLTHLLSQSITEYGQDVQNLIQPTIYQAIQVRDTIVNPLISSVRREISAIVAKMHGSRTSASSGKGIYMQELNSKLGFIREELFGRMRKHMREQLLVETTQHLLRTFLFHASLVTPLQESTKLRLAADLAELEFGIAQFLSSDEHEEINYELEGLRTFRQLLFSDDETEVNDLIQDPNLDELIMIHHLIVKGQSENDQKELNQETPQIKLIHQLNGWNPAEYLRWVEGHPNRKERIELIKKSILSETQTDEKNETDSSLYKLGLNSKHLNKWARLALKLIEEAQ
ncbi:hypothetical protein O181_065104 [Austropuccinia psidii MF-1]|uniref:Conserved oligomeric Golgi complex subunit 5 n=1 Tax=Austropuccinia psidii MF-1 TaxID=1389203 RepID=A0A9Q3EQF6_9BASI|nr:hypothetical protein [Austropuccinia psidii MF-1]